MPAQSRHARGDIGNMGRKCVGEGMGVGGHSIFEADMKRAPTFLLEIDFFP